MNNQNNSNGSPVSSWLGGGNFNNAINNPIKSLKKAPRSYTYKLYNVFFWMQTLNIVIEDGDLPGNINIDFNLWNINTLPINTNSLAGRSSERIARSRIYYNKFGSTGLMQLNQGDTIAVGNGWTQSGTDVVVTTNETGTIVVDRDIEGNITSPMNGTDWFQWRPIPNWSFKGLVTSPILYFSVSHGGVNNLREYGSAKTIFGCTIEYDLVKISEYIENKNY